MDYTNPSKAWKPSTAYKKSRRFQSTMDQNLLNQTKSLIDLNASYVNPGLLPNFNIVAEMNGKAIDNQDKDIEIERLKTTCTDLNNKASVADDLRRDNEIISRRLSESENER
jgi:hypothetical protein